MSLCFVVVFPSRWNFAHAVPSFAGNERSEVWIGCEESVVGMFRVFHDTAIFLAVLAMLPLPQGLFSECAISLPLAVQSSPQSTRYASAFLDLYEGGLHPRRFSVSALCASRC